MSNINSKNTFNSIYAVIFCDIFIQFSTYMLRSQLLNARATAFKKIKE